MGAVVAAHVLVSKEVANTVASNIDLPTLTWPRTRRKCCANSAPPSGSKEASA